MVQGIAVYVCDQNRVTIATALAKQPHPEVLYSRGMLVALLFARPKRMEVRGPVVEPRR